MANLKSAIKRVRQNEKRRMRNRMVRSRMRTYLSKARADVETADPATAAEAVRQAVAELDKAARKGVIHPNAAARRKSALMKRLNAQQKAAEQ